MLTRKKVTLRASKITLNVPEKEKKKQFKIPFWIWLPLFIIGVALFSTLFTPQNTDIPDYMTTKNEYKPITPQSQEIVKVENNNLFVCNDQISSINDAVCTTLNIFSSWVGIVLLLPALIILFQIWGGIRRIFW
jgi:hypothetical protein